MRALLRANGSGVPARVVYAEAATSETGPLPVCDPLRFVRPLRQSPDRVSAPRRQARTKGPSSTGGQDSGLVVWLGRGRR
jgi:hypothetical protein